MNHFVIVGKKKANKEYIQLTILMEEPSES